jgi:hypothetical protein
VPGLPWCDECGRIERFANSETNEDIIDRDFHRSEIFSSDQIPWCRLDTRNNVGKPCSLRRVAAPLALSAIWSICLVDFCGSVSGTEGWPHGSVCTMADIEVTQRYGLRQARVRALRIVAAYASIRELSESEFCRLVDDLTIASASMPPSTDNRPTS